jgi:Na+/H+-dicarboxylate symporter
MAFKFAGMNLWTWIAILVGVLIVTAYAPGVEMFTLQNTCPDGTRTKDGQCLMDF